MITGTVNADREAVIRLRVMGTNGQRRDFDAIIDMGFTSFSPCLPLTSQRASEEEKVRRLWKDRDANAHIQFCMIDAQRERA